MYRLPLVLLLLLAAPAHANVLSRCMHFLRTESGSVVPWNSQEDQEDATKLDDFARSRPWPETFIEAVVGDSSKQVQRAFLDRIRTYSFAYLFGFDVKFDYSGLVFCDGNTDNRVIDIVGRPQRLLHFRDLPSAER